MNVPPWLPPGPALLFAPADRPERFGKAAGRADGVIVDLEDGAAAADPVAKRANVLAHPLDPARTILRVSGPDAPTFADDARLVHESPYDVVMLPKVRDRIPEELAGLRVIAMIETPQAMLAAGDIAAHPDVVGLFWGAEDLAAELGGTSSRRTVAEDPARSYRQPQQLARTLTLVHAAAAGKVAIDAVHADFRDEEGQYLEALDAAGAGFAATACIHPAMVPAVRRAYFPAEEELARARAILARAGEHQGAFQLDGEMIDAPIVRQAALIARRAGR